MPKKDRANLYSLIKVEERTTSSGYLRFGVDFFKNIPVTAGLMLKKLQYIFWDVDQLNDPIILREYEIDTLKVIYNVPLVDVDRRKVNNPKGRAIQNFVLLFKHSKLQNVRPYMLSPHYGFLYYVWR